jgi:regulator of protease activity HflC (stomatin/prohibitin superfamily)
MTGAIVFVCLLFIFLLFILIRLQPLRRVIIYEYQRGLKYTKGRHVGTLDPGRYWILSAASSIVPVDIRPEFVTIQGQEVLSADGVTLKISLAAEFQVVDPYVAVNRNVNFRNATYLTLQMALREIVGEEKIDALLDNRAQISKKLLTLAAGKIAEFGVKLISADVKDIMFPGEMKKTFAQVVKARKEGQAALERSRGETAALRSLANAARIIDENPNLLHLRALQTLAESPGNTLVLGVPNGTVPIRSQGGKDNKAATPGPETEETVSRSEFRSIVSTRECFRTGARCAYSWKVNEYLNGSERESSGRGDELPPKLPTRGNDLN